MSFDKPFHRNRRQLVERDNSGYSSWAYIVDRDYSVNPEHYTRAFLIIQSDIIDLFKYVEPSDINLPTYSFRIHELLMRVCIEVESNFKAILKENIFSPIYKRGPNAGELRPEKLWTIDDFKVVNKTHHLDDYKIQFPIWNGLKHTVEPFKEWKLNTPLSWYQAYNQSKHDRQNEFTKANLENLLLAFAGLCALLTSQFGGEDFAPGAIGFNALVDSYYSGEFGIGNYLMIHFPTNWMEDEKYDFDWSSLREEAHRFNKIDYNTLL